MGCICEKSEGESKQSIGNPANSGEDYNPKASKIKSKDSAHYRNTH